MPIFIRRSRIPAPAEAVFDWHARPGAFERLTPPWQPVEIVERSGAEALKTEPGSSCACGSVLFLRRGPPNIGIMNTADSSATAKWRARLRAGIILIGSNRTETRPVILRIISTTPCPLGRSARCVAARLPVVPLTACSPIGIPLSGRMWPPTLPQKETRRCTLL